VTPRARSLLRWAALALPCLAFALLIGTGHALAQRNSPFGVTQPEANLPGLANPLFAWIYIQTAHGEAVKKGVLLSFAFALVQAVSAIVIVTVLTGLFNTTAAVMDNTTLALERLSNVMVMAIGAWLLWRKGGALWGLVAARYGLPGAGIHVHGAECGHLAMPPETDGARRNSIRAILLASLRPCTGALVVLVLRHGLYDCGHRLHRRDGERAGRSPRGSRELRRGRRRA
jgi:nickel/cobalt exporter